MYEADIKKPEGERLTKFELEGHPILARKTYRLAVNNYRAMGGGFYPEYSISKIEQIGDKDYTEMFQEYLTKGRSKSEVTHNYYFK